jgi:outer membrane cobalamin receptor
MLSPIVQLSSTPSSLDKTRFKLAMVRSFKTPNPRDLIPVRWRSPNNTPTEPDQEGNELLRPETSWSIDASVEQSFAGIDVTLNGYVKRIDDVVAIVLTQDFGRWVARQSNVGLARVWGAEIDLAVQQSKIYPEAPDVRWSLYAAANRSRLDSADGQQRDLDVQAPWLVRLGFEHRLKASRWRWGGQWQVEGGSSYAATPSELKTKDALSTLDMYCTYTSAAKHTIRLSVTNLLGRDSRDTQRFSSPALSSQVTRIERSAPTFRLSWRMPM